MIPDSSVLRQYARHDGVVEYPAGSSCWCMGSSKLSRNPTGQNNPCTTAPRHQRAERYAEHRPLLKHYKSLNSIKLSPLDGTPTRRLPNLALNMEHPAVCCHPSNARLARLHILHRAHTPTQLSSPASRQLPPITIRFLLGTHLSSTF